MPSPISLRSHPAIFRTALIAVIGILPGGPVIGQESSWKPSFNDAPVNDGARAKIEAAVPTEPIVAPKAARKLLVYSATAGFRHKSIPFGKIALEEMGKKSGAYDVVISDDPANFEPAALKEFDAVVLLNPTLQMFQPPEKELKAMPANEQKALELRQERLTQSLVDYVTAGGGLVGIHSATDACYHHDEFGHMIGGYFDGHPWNHDSKVTIVVEDPDHELNKPVFKDKSFTLIEEIYQFKEKPYSRERLRVLLHLDPERSTAVGNPKRKDNDYPVAWVQQFGQGRVFYTSIGHNNDMFWNPMILKHYLAGIQFATGDLPADTTPSAK